MKTLGNVEVNNLAKSYGVAPGVVEKIAEEAVNKSIALSTATRAQLLLEKNADKFSSNVQKKIASKDFSLVDVDYLIRKQIGLTGTDQLTQDQDKKVGLSDFDNKKLSENAARVIDRVSLAYATHATITNAADVEYSKIDVNTPVQLQNAILVIKVAGKEKVSIPFIRGLNIGGTFDQVGGQVDVIHLDRPFTIDGSEEVDIDIKYPASSLTAPTDNHFVEARLLGAELR